MIYWFERSLKLFVVRLGNQTAAQSSDFSPRPLVCSRECNKHSFLWSLPFAGAEQHNSVINYKVELLEPADSFNGFLNNHLWCLSHAHRKVVRQLVWHFFFFFDFIDPVHGGRVTKRYYPQPNSPIETVSHQCCVYTAGDETYQRE